MEIGLIHLNWGYSATKLSRLSDNWRRGVTKSYSKNAIVKKKYVLRYLCGQERLCRTSGLAQHVTRAMLNLGAKDCDMHRVLKVACLRHSWSLATLTGPTSQHHANIECRR